MLDPVTQCLIVDTFLTKTYDINWSQILNNISLILQVVRNYIWKNSTYQIFKENSFIPLQKVSGYKNLTWPLKLSVMIATLTSTNLSLSVLSLLLMLFRRRRDLHTRGWDSQPPRGRTQLYQDQHGLRRHLQWTGSTYFSMLVKSSCKLLICNFYMIDNSSRLLSCPFEIMLN